MTGPAQVAVNHAAITAAAERLTATGWQGDAHAFIENLLLEAIRSGYRPLDSPPAPRGPGSTDRARREAREAARAAVAAARARRTAVTDTDRKAEKA